jgi:hypothetical protein
VTQSNDLNVQDKNTIRVTRIDLRTTEHAARWDAIVRASPQANPYSTSRWARAVHDAIGIEHDLWIVEKGEAWLGGVLVPVRSRFGQRAGVVTPVTAYSSPVYAESLYKSALPSKVTANLIEVGKPLAEAVASSYSAARHVMLPAVSDVRPWQWSGWTATPSYTFHLDIARELPLSHSVRKHVQKCERNGAQVSDTWDFDAFWSVQESTVVRQGVRLGVTRDELFAMTDAMHRAGLAWMLTARDADGSVLSSRVLLGIAGTSTVFDWVAGSDATKLSTGASPWLMTKVAQEAARRGFTYWDLCGAQFESIAKFKGEFGGALVHGFVVSAPPSLAERAYGMARGYAGSVIRHAKRRRR